MKNLPVADVFFALNGVKYFFEWAFKTQEKGALFCVGKTHKNTPEKKFLLSRFLFKNILTTLENYDKIPKCVIMHYKCVFTQKTHNSGKEENNANH